MVDYTALEGVLFNAAFVQDGVIDWLRGPLALDLQYVKAVEIDPRDDSGALRLRIASARN